MATVGVKGLTL